MMSPMLCLAVALTALGLLVMLGASWLMTPARQAWPSRLFDGGAGIFGLALVFWMVVAIVPFFAGFHGL
jgi:hypothetical protein